MSHIEIMTPLLVQVMPVLEKLTTKAVSLTRPNADKDFDKERNEEKMSNAMTKSRTLISE